MARPLAVLGGFLVVTGMLGVSSLLVWPHWIPEWLRVVFGYRQYATPPLVRYLLGDQLGSRLGPVVIAALLAERDRAGLAHARGRCDVYRIRLTMSLLLAITTITLLPGHAVYDHVVLLPGVILIAMSWRELRSLEPPLSGGPGRDRVGPVLAMDSVLRL